MSLIGPAVPRFIDPGVDAAAPYIDDLLALNVEAAESAAFITELMEVEVTEVKEAKVKRAMVGGVAIQAWGVELSEEGQLQPPSHTGLLLNHFCQHASC